MPRGVPASGKRQPRAVPTAQYAADEAVAGSTVDDEVGMETPAETPVEIPTFELIEEPAPEPEEEPSAEQLEIKRLRDLLARQEGNADVVPEVEENGDAEGERIVIHFLEDGLTANGRVMYRGDELEYVVGSRAYKDTFNRRGQTWLDLRHDEFAQVERFQKVMFRNGPWPGKTYADGTFEAMRGDKEGSKVAPPSVDELARAEKLRQRRAAPYLPQQV